MSDGAPLPSSLPDWLLGASYPWHDERAALLFQLLTRNVPLPSGILPLAQTAGVDLSAVRESRGRETWADVLDSVGGHGPQAGALLRAFAERVPAAAPSLAEILAAPPPDARMAPPRLPRTDADVTTREELRRFLAAHLRAWVAYHLDNLGFKRAAAAVGQLVRDEKEPVAWVLLPEDNDPRTGLPEVGPCLIEYENGDIVRRISLSGGVPPRGPA